MTQIVQASSDEAVSFIRKNHDTLAQTYKVQPVQGIGANGFSVRPGGGGQDRMLTLLGHRANVVVMTQLDFLGGVTDKQQAAAVALTQEALTLGNDPAAQQAATNCPYFDLATLQKLLPGKGLRQQVHGATSCMAQSGDLVVILSVTPDVADPAGWIARMTGGCQTEAVAALGSAARLSWACGGAQPQASVRYDGGGNLVEFHFAPLREPTASERALLVELARKARDKR